MAPDRIGFDRVIRLRWLDRAALLAAELRDADALHQAILAQLAVELPGVDARRKTANVLTRIWWRVPEEHIPLRNEALAQMVDCAHEERLLFHWGMCLLAYPIFRDVAATAGRLLRLQGIFRQAQVVSRIGAVWGNRSTLETAVPRILRSQADWGVLTAASERGGYLVGPTLSPAPGGPVLWLLATLLESCDAEVLVNDLFHAPELFPFAVTLSPSALAQSGWFRLQQVGQRVLVVFGGDHDGG